MEENQQSQQFIYANNKQALLAGKVHKHATHSITIPDSGDPDRDAYLLFCVWCRFAGNTPFYIHYQWMENATVILTTSEENKNKIWEFVNEHEAERNEYTHLDSVDKTSSVRKKI